MSILFRMMKRKRMNPRLARRVNLPPMMIMMMDLIKNNLNTQQFSENLFGHWKNKIPAFYNIKGRGRMRSFLEPAYISDL